MDEESFGLVHGDFHPGNVIAVVKRLKSENPDRSPKDYQACPSDQIVSAVPIDFANVGEGQVPWVDFGKYLRDLRERTISKCFHDPKHPEIRINIHRELSIALPSTNLVKCASRILKDTLKVLGGRSDPRKLSYLQRAALLYYEITLLLKCFEDWDECERLAPGDGKRQALVNWRGRYAQWQDADHAVSAILYGIDWAAGAFA
jgi:hypothetical protein